MGVKSNIPQIVILRKRVEERFGKLLAVHADFVSLVEVIEKELRQHISESTLERVWGYSTRGYATVSLRTLDVLAGYAEGCDWHTFCERLVEDGVCDSNIFDSEVILASDLSVGDRLRIGWLPNRVCLVRYLGDNRFVADECEHSKLHVGDTFSCIQFAIGASLIMSDLRCSDGREVSKTYIAGQKNGLTQLSLLSDDRD